MRATINSPKHSNGIYYTPAAIARALARWALRNPHERVFDPCYGGCAFLDASSETLEMLGAENPASQLWGVDLDPAAQVHSRRFVDRGASPDQFLIGDFLTLNPAAITAVPFQVVLANPPYVRHHLLTAETAHVRAELAQAATAQISGRASQWAYFVVHLMEFIAPGGRAAFVLPSSLLTADYAVEVRRILIQGFRSLTALLIEDRLFDDAQEATVVVLGEGHGQGPAQVRVGLATLHDVGDLTAERLERLSRPIRADQISGRWLGMIVEPAALDILQRLVTQRQAIELGRVASIGVGTVTGKNSFFIIRSSLQRELALTEDYVRPLITHVAQLPGLLLTSGDVSRLVAADQQILLIAVSGNGPVPPSLAAYLAEGEWRGVANGYKCSRRTPWYAVPVTAPSDAFLPYMAGHAPRIVLNDAGVSCTNTVLRVNWTAPTSADEARALSLASSSTITQLSAELVGRSYGGGVLKLEPSDAARLLLPCCSVLAVRSAFDRVHRLFAEGKRELATVMVDRLLENAGILRPDESQVLKQALAQARRWRAGKSVLPS